MSKACICFLLLAHNQSETPWKCLKRDRMNYRSDVLSGQKILSLWSCISSALFRQVKALKEKIEAERGKDNFPVSGQKLIYAGKILQDDTPIKDYKIDEKNFVVVMVSKVRLGINSRPILHFTLLTMVRKEHGFSGLNGCFSTAFLYNLKLWNIALFILWILMIMGKWELAFGNFVDFSKFIYFFIFFCIAVVFHSEIYVQIDFLTSVWCCITPWFEYFNQYSVLFFFKYWLKVCL